MHYICATCGTQFAESDQAPEHCPICRDPRQYVGWQGQEWTTMDRLRQSHRNEVAPEGPGLTGIVTRPAFAIGQRALHLRAGGGVLWDCVSLVDQASIAALQDLGGVAAMAISHPHFYSAMVEWSRALGGVPVYLHAADREWVMRPDSALVFWEGEEHSLGPGLTLLRLGGHFAGGTVLHWEQGENGRGAVLSGDILQVSQDRRSVSVMRSYPNYIPVGPAAIRRIRGQMARLRYAAVYGGWTGRNIIGNASDLVDRSLGRYLDAIGGDG